MYASTRQCGGTTRLTIYLVIYHIFKSVLAKPNYYVFHIKCIYDNTKSFIFIQLSFEIQQLIWCLRIFFKDLCPWLYIETYTYSSTGPGITYFCQLWFYYCIHRSSPRWYPYSTFYKNRLRTYVIVVFETNVFQNSLCSWTGHFSDSL